MPKLSTVTPKDVMGWEPCLHRERVLDFFGRRKRVNALDVLQTEKIRSAHKLWCVLRPAMLPRQLLHELACDFAARVLERFGDENDFGAWWAVAAKLGWLEGLVSDRALSEIACRVGVRAHVRAIREPEDFLEQVTETILSAASTDDMAALHASRAAGWVTWWAILVGKPGFSWTSRAVEYRAQVAHVLARLRGLKAR